MTISAVKLAKDIRSGIDLTFFLALQNPALPFYPPPLFTVNNFLELNIAAGEMNRSFMGMLFP